MKTEREKMTNAEPFLTTDPQLMEDKKNARLLWGEEEPQHDVKAHLPGTLTEYSERRRNKVIRN